MKIQVVNDIHLEFEPLNLTSNGADIIILAGDIHLGTKGATWALESFNKPVIYVLGNHEYYRHCYPNLLQKLKRLTEGTHVHILENDILEMDGFFFYGCTLWTDYNLFGDPRLAGMECQQKMTDFDLIRMGPTRAKAHDFSKINRNSYVWLEKNFDRSMASQSIVVTHHAPSFRSIPSQYQKDLVSAAYASHFDELVLELQPKLWIHGHIHESQDYKLGETRILCNPRGYPGERNPKFDPNLTINLES